MVFLFCCIDRIRVDDVFNFVGLDVDYNIVIVYVINEFCCISLSNVFYRF